MDQHKDSLSGLEFVVDVKPDRLRAKSSAEITDQRMESVVGRLLKAQEEECRRISREIHDDLGGRITEIGLLIQHIKKSAILPKKTVSELDQLRDKTIEISKVIGKLSHRLHSPVLEFTGIGIALESLCREFQAHTGIRIEFVPGSKVTDIPDEIALCLYRIAQESLNNVAKHSGAKTVRVELTRMADEAHLTIRDFGQGFTSRTRRKSGLGLISMEERVRLLQGTLQIQTQPGGGTRVRTTIPIKSRKTLPNSHSKRAVGRG